MVFHVKNNFQQSNLGLPGYFSFPPNMVESSLSMLRLRHMVIFRAIFQLGCICQQ